MKYLITDCKAPWPHDVTRKLFLRGLFTVDQLIRISRLPDGISNLALTTGTDADQWERWIEMMAGLVTEDDLKLTAIEADKLLKRDMLNIELAKDGGRETDK